MIYRKLPHRDEKISILGLGANDFAENGDPGENLKTYEMAIDNGITLFDLAGGNEEPFEPLGKAIKGKRDQVYLQMHFGADYTQYKYGWTQDLKKIEESVELQMRKLNTDYVDFGFIHCLDKLEEIEKAVNGGTLAMLQKYKE